MTDYEPDDDLFDPDDNDLGDNDDETLACPSCRNAVHEDTQKCPHCGDWIIPVEPTSRKRRFFYVAVAVMLLLVLLFFVFR